MIAQSSPDVSPAMMASLPLYQALVAHLSVSPDVSLAQTPAPCPEEWPVLIASLQWQRRTLQGFWVSDGRSPVFCQTSLPEVLDKVATLGEGAIIHLKETQPFFRAKEKQYGWDVGFVLTLKEFDTEVQQEQARLAERQKRVHSQLKAEGWIPEPNEEASAAEG